MCETQNVHGDLQMDYLFAKVDIKYHCSLDNWTRSGPHAGSNYTSRHMQDECYLGGATFPQMCA